MKPRIQIVLTRPDGRSSNVSISGDPVTATMLEAAENLIGTLSTGDPAPLPDGLYEAVALAFDTTRDDAKNRLAGALYGKRGTRLP
jgi:Mg-chelatase subunit ChlD